MGRIGMQCAYMVAADSNHCSSYAYPPQKKTPSSSSGNQRHNKTRIFFFGLKKKEGLKDILWLSIPTLGTKERNCGMTISCTHEATLVAYLCCLFPRKKIYLFWRNTESVSDTTRATYLLLLVVGCEGKGKLELKFLFLSFNASEGRQRQPGCG